MTQKNVLERDTNRTGRLRPSGEPVFLVLERDPLIADDITGSLMAIGPCRVIHASDAGSILTMLRDERGISAAFLDISFARVVGDGLDQKLNAHGARIILTVGEDDQAQALARGWAMLVRPFTDDMIRDVVVPKPIL